MFEDAGALDQLEQFTSLNGPAFYNLPVNSDTITLTKGAAANWPDRIACEDGPVTVFDPGFPVYWTVTDT